MRKKKFKVRHHPFIYQFVRFVSFLYTRIIYGYRSKAKFKMKKDEPIIVLSNHQTDVDPFCIFSSFNRPIYPIATDNIFAGKFASRIFSWLGVVPKKKGASDVNTAMSMQRKLRKNQSLLLFLEGNRTYAEFQYYISDSIVNFIRNLKLTIVLFNLKGGTGKSPRFKNKRRKGPFTGEIKRVLRYTDYETLSDEEFFKIIKDSLRVFDSESGALYKSNKRAEYLERIFFICPKCGQMETLYSKGNFLYCYNCDFKMEYKEDLSLESKDVKFARMIDYWNYQKRFISNLNVEEGKAIFTDKKVKIRLTNPFEKKRTLYKGSILMDDKSLYYGDRSFNILDIEQSSVISGRKLTFLIGGNNYTIRGHKRFNPLKYVFMFNKLETKMKILGSDKYYNLEEN